MATAKENKKHRKNHSVNVGGKRHQAPDGKKWTHKKVKKLGIKIESTVPAGQTVKHRSHKVVHEIIANPVVKSVTITPSNNILFDARDPISDGDYAITWEYFDSESQKQVGFSINVFTNHQYIQPDFDVTDTSKALWYYVSGVDDATSHNINTNDGYVNGGQYWVFVRVAKEYNGNHYYSDWEGTSFNVTYFQPQIPLVSVNPDYQKARNEIAITSSDNLFSADNSAFLSGTGGWKVTDNDSALSDIRVAVTPNSLRTPLTNNAPISSLPIGAFGGLLTPIGSSGGGSFKVTGSSSSAAASHLSITGSTTTGSSQMTVSSINGIINGMAVVGDGIPNGTTVVGTSTNGTTTFYVNLSAKATSNNTSYTYIFNYYDATDAIGFPRSGRFWVQINSECFLVENQRDGNNTGDTFNIIQRAYRGTSQSSHSKGATVMYGLQEDIYSGFIGDIIQAYDTSEGSSSVNHHTVSVLRHSGAAASSSETMLTTLLITQSTSGVANTSEKVIYVNDPQDVLSAGQLIRVEAFGEVNATKYNAVGSGKNSSIKVSTASSIQVTAYADAKITNVIGAYAPTSERVTIGTVANNYVVDGAHNSLSTIRINTTNTGSYNLPDQGARGNINACYKAPAGIIPRGTTLYITMGDSYYLPITSGSADSAKQSGYKEIAITLTEDVNLNVLGNNSTLQSVGLYANLHFTPIKNANGFQYVNNSGAVQTIFCIPANASVQIAQNIASKVKKVTLDQSLNQGTMKGHSVQVGDHVIVKNYTYTAGTPATYGTETVTTQTKTITQKSVDQTQSFVVDYNPSARPVTWSGTTLGTWNSGTSTFTALNSSGTINSAIFNAVKITTTSTINYNGYSVSMEGLPLGTTVVSTNSVSGGYVIYFGSGTTGVQPQNGLSSWRTTVDGVFYPSNHNIISSSLSTPTMSIPVVPFVPQHNFLRHTNVKFYSKTLFGDNAMRVTAGSSGSADISIYSGDKWNNQNSIPVNAGMTYGFCAVGTAFNGASLFPKMTLHVDWYDEFGNLLKSSNGSESLSNPGSFNTFTNYVSLGTSLTTNSGWSPYAIAVLAPTISFSSSATYTATDAFKGFFTLSSNYNPGLVTGSYLLVNGKTIAVTNTTTSDFATSIYVSFPYGGAPQNGENASLSVGATRACPRINVINLNANDVLGFCGLMFKALTPYLPSPSYVALNTQLPALKTTVGVGSGNYESGMAIPNTTPTSGEQTIYLFDPTNDNGSREVHQGAGTSSLTTRVSLTAIAGASSIVLDSVVGLAVGSQITIGSGSKQEVVTVSNSWRGTNTVNITEPLVNLHNPNEIATAGTTSITGHFIETQTAGTKVAVFNFNNDGFINTPNTRYSYKVERSDDLGANYTTIFNGGSLVADPSGVGLISDLEVTPNADTYYRITPSFVDSKGNNLLGVSIENLESPILTTNSWWIASSSDPDNRYAINVQNGVQETQKHPVGVFYPLGSSRPIIISGVVQGRDASITIVWTDNANWENFISLLNLGETLVLTNPVEASKRYIAINDDITVTHNSGGSPWRQVVIKYVEAPPPNGYGYTYGQ